MSQWITMIDTLDNDDYFFKKSELIKQKSLLELAFSVGSLYEYQDKEEYEFFKWFCYENKKELKIKFMRKFKNGDEEVFKNFVRIYLRTSPPLGDLWFYNEYGDEFPIEKQRSWVNT